MRIGIDLGGTKISAIAMDGCGHTHAKLRIPSPRNSYRHTLEALCDIVERLEREIGRRCQVGIGMPGAISPATGLVKNANSTWLNGTPLDRDLACALNRPVRIENDANCFALSEAIDGAGAGAPSVFGIILGTGVGGGVVIGQSLVSGRDAIAGEWGHNPLPAPLDSERPGPLCYCGRHGCVETFLSGPALALDAECASAEEVVIKASAGDTRAETALCRYEDRLARALATVINILDPHVIVLGGGLSNLDRLYQNVPPLLADHVFSDRAGTPILKARHGDDSGVRGAAWLWPAETTKDRSDARALP